MRQLAPIVPKLLFGLVLAALIAFIALPLRPGPGTASAADQAKDGDHAATPWQPTPDPVPTNALGGPRNFGEDPTSPPAKVESAPADHEHDGAAEPSAPQDEQPTKGRPWEQDDFRIDTATPIGVPGDYALVDPDHLPMSFGELGW